MRRSIAQRKRAATESRSRKETSTAQRRTVRPSGVAAARLLALIPAAYMAAPITHFVAFEVGYLIDAL
jgi:hypothetical protein